VKGRSALAVLVSTLTALVVFAARFVDVPVITVTSQRIMEWTVVVAAFALGLGAVNLARVSIKNISARRGKSWWLNIVTLVFLVVPAVTGIALGPNHKNYLWMYNTFYVPLNASIVALGVFWICSASYRAFRLRNLHSFLLLASSTIVMIGSMGLGQKYLPYSPKMSEWILNVVSSAIMRSMGIITAIGMAGVGLRIVVGLERRPLAGGDSGE